MAVAIPLSRGLSALIDDADYEAVSAVSWAAKPAKSTIPGRFYAFGKVNGKQLYLHRYLMNANKGQFVDHVNGNGLDNRRCNLRFSSISENNANRFVPVPKSGFRGVVTENGSFRAQVGRPPNFYRGPWRRTALEAAHEYDAEAFRRFGEFARLNFPENFK
jgi:hypothetical protein